MLLIDTLPTVDKEAFTAELSQALKVNNQILATALVQHSFTRKEFDQALEWVMYEDMEEMAEEAYPSLPSDKQEKLHQYMSKLRQQASHISVAF